MESTKRRALSRSAEYSVERRGSRHPFDAVISQLLQHYQEELNNTKNQLQCLIHFVRRAWTGDVEASIHVANIVGVAPPDLCLQGDTNRIVAIPKTTAINNWAILTHGLLKQECPKNEKDQRREQLEYLLERKEFLDKQLSRLGHQKNMRGEKDCLCFIDNKVQRDNKKEQNLKETSRTKKHDFSSSQTYLANCWVGTPKDNFDVEKLKWFGLYIDASKPQLAQRKIATKGAWHGRAKSAGWRVSETSSSKLNSKAYSSAPKTFPHARLSNSIEKKYLTVHIRKRTQRAQSANDVGITERDNATKVNYREASNGNSAPYQVSMSDDAERRLRRIIPELERKLNLNPKGQLIF